MPLVRDQVEKADVKNYWKGKTVGGNLFEERREIIFPKISNCINCFHKIEEVLMYEALINPNKMNWAAGQEHKGMGTWLDSRKTYDAIIEQANALTPEERQHLIRKITKVDGNGCDVGGCTD